MTSQKRSAWVIMVTACVAAPAWGCSGGSCYPQVSYIAASLELPDNATLDCTVTFVGSANTGTYDCPPPVSSILRGGRRRAAAAGGL